ncbi:aldo/keto reductase [Auritidibacter ignavus]|uniref:aldo/keto reductase n=1 Tax=Auritidibacter ignavus TaxID=678932 RepID=UPI000F03B1DD|nr:aldo/keto reductase [Auritidibacter ignavus]NIH71095.1 aryl-alcohol dehydrogenase-like predicted oxidoreductase [Auritidibacter ignavus]RMX22381.1 aldo/keto reductase [Auritidibacter ignavus]WHS28827.1 aldo/keto reductase [Auritidibacter ignavus]
MTQQRVTIPQTDLDVFPLNLGTNTFGWTADEPTAHRILDAYCDAGGNFLDTADTYPHWAPNAVGGESEAVIGSWLARQPRDRVVVATKVRDFPQAPQTLDYLQSQVKESLRRLQTDYIDLYYGHFDNTEVPIADQAQAFDELVTAGHIRYIGLSNYSPDRMREWFRVARKENLALPVAIQPHYNLVRRADYENTYRAVAEENNLAVFPYFGLAAGFLTGKYHTEADLETERKNHVSEYFNADGLRVVDQLVEVAQHHQVQPASVALAWLLARGVTAPIASARTAEQLPALLEATTLQLSDEEVRLLTEASEIFA